MSAGLLIQQRNNYFIGADRASSIKIKGDKRVRVGNNFIKINKINDNFIYFCSGNKKETQLINAFICKETNINKIKNYCLQIHKSIESELEILILNNNPHVKSIQLSSYNNFKPITRETNEEETLLITLGIKTKELYEVAKNKILESGNISCIFKESFEHINSPEVGGKIDMFFSIDGKIGSKIIDIEDKYLSKMDIDSPFENLIIANQLIGQVILGHKLYVTSENGEFYIGDMNNNSQGFGLRITDDGKKERVFLGTELVNGQRKARLRLYNKSGQGLNLSEEGIIQTYQWSDRDHVDQYNRANFYFWSDSSVIDYKSVYIHIVFKPYRVYSKSLSAGGTVNQHTGTSVTGGGGSTTSASGGAYAGTSAVDGGYSSSTTVTSGQNSTYWDIVRSDPITNEEQKVNGGHHFHSMSKILFNHTHDVTISVNVPSHSHYVQIPSHSHYVEIPPHSHTIDLSFSTMHTHDINYGIIDLNGNDNYPSNVSLIINGKQVKGNIQNNETIDIKNYMTKGVTAPNTIRLTSSTRGLFHVSFFVKSFNSFE